MRRLGPVALLALFTLACETGAGGRQARGPCQTPADSVIADAVRQYVVTLVPRPQRFLVAIGDSAPPEAARAALQGKGPTYLYSTDPALQKQVHDKLASVGDYPTLLLSYGGLQLVDGDRTVVRLGGRFVGGSLDNHPAPTKAVHFECDSARWRFTRAVEEQRS